MLCRSLTEPLTPLEVQLQAIFDQALSRPSSVNNLTSLDNFSRTSSSTMQILALIGQQLNINIDVDLLIANPSARQLAAVLPALVRRKKLMDDINHSVPSLRIETLLIVLLVCQYLFPLWIGYRLSMPIISFVLLVPLCHLLMFILYSHLIPVSPGQYKLFSRQYYQVWFLNRIWRRNEFWLRCLVDTSFFNCYLRACGARIGRNVHVCTTLIDMPCLISIGSGTFVADQVYLNNAAYDVQSFSLFSINLGANCTIGSRAVLYEDVTLDDDVVIDSLTAVTGRVIKDPNISGSTIQQRQMQQTAAHKLSKLVSIIGVVLLSTLSLSLARTTYHRDLPAFISLPICWLVWVLLQIIIAAIALKFIVGDVKPGRYSLESWTYVRGLWLRQLLVSVYIYPLSFLNCFQNVACTVLRYLNAHIDDHNVKFADMLSILRFPSNLLSVGSSVTFFGGVQLVPFEVTRDRECFVHHIRIDEFVEAGNFCSIHPGSHLPRGVHVGTLTRIEKHTASELRTNTIVLGIPGHIMPFASQPSLVDSEFDDLKAQGSIRDTIISFAQQVQSKAVLVLILSYTIPLSNIICALLLYPFFILTLHYLIRNLSNASIAIPHFLFNHIHTVANAMMDDLIRFLEPYLEGSQWLVYFHRYYGAQIIGDDVLLFERFNVSDNHMVTIKEHVRISVGSSAMVSSISRLMKNAIITHLFLFDRRTHLKDVDIKRVRL